MCIPGWAGGRVSLPRGQVPVERVLWQDVAGERQTETCASMYSRLDGGLGYRSIMGGVGKGWREGREGRLAIVESLV